MAGTDQEQARPAAEAQPSIIASAQAALAGGSPGACLALLAALPPAQRQQLPVHQLQALCHIRLARRPSPCAAWWKVFGLEAKAASAADIRRQYKRLAALVHPDKCASPGASDAFKSLRAAADCLLHAVQAEPEAQAGDGTRSSKRARTEGANRAGWAAGSGVQEAGGEAEDEEDEEAVEWVPDGGGFPWWEEWDHRPPTEPARQRASAAAGESAGPAAASRQGGGAAAAQQEEQAQLEQLGLEELRAEVQRRQAAIWAPPLDASGQRVPLQRLQAELRQARSLLSERTAGEAAAAAGATGGGFLPS